ncbi:MAG TPA: hypothetical protein VE053_01370 [Allosphingosinicella sp.]|nr:hypothetical protein [Allosphingosinicella sp.]
MIDDEDRVRPGPGGDSAAYGESLLYDFSKFLTTLAILALGGVLTLTQTADRSDIKTTNIIIAVVAIALAGTLALTTANSIAYARASAQALPRNLHRYMLAAMGLLGTGVGSFLYMWMDTLN